VNHPSITRICEHDMVDRLLSEPGGLNRIINISGFPSDGVALTRVPLDDVPAKPDNNGDVDILLVGENRPEDSVAIEVKRLTVPAAAVRNLSVYNVGELKKAGEQASKLARIGFARAYLYAFVAVDTREQNAGTDSWNGAPMEVRGMIENELRMRRPELDPRVGLYVPSFTQPVDEAPLVAGSFHGHLRRPATPVRQSLQLTKWIAQKVISHPHRIISSGSRFAAHNSIRFAITP
jgi:hypothetical protein